MVFRWFNWGLCLCPQLFNSSQYCLKIWFSGISSGISSGIRSGFCASSASAICATVCFGHFFAFEFMHCINILFYSSSFDCFVSFECHFFGFGLAFPALS